MPLEHVEVKITHEEIERLKSIGHMHFAAKIEGKQYVITLKLGRKK